MARTVLVIDDSDLIRAVAQLALGRQDGWEVICAESGAEGLDLARRNRPDAVLLDVVMPGLDGPDTHKRLRDDDSTREVPVIFLTAQSDEADLARLAELDVAGVIAKPFDPAGLAAQVSELLGWDL
jgi:DNA-binding response OmpR family regulator